MSARWDYFKEGESLGKAGLKILELVEAKQTMFDTKYLILFLCCGTRREASHKFIMSRLRETKKSVCCKTCFNVYLKTKNKNHMANVEAREKRNRIVNPGYHGWIPPNSSLELPAGWMTR